MSSRSLFEKEVSGAAENIPKPAEFPSVRGEHMAAAPLWCLSPTIEKAAEWVKRSLRLARELDKRGMILNLMFFYQGQDEVLADPGLTPGAALFRRLYSIYLHFSGHARSPPHLDDAESL